MEDSFKLGKRKQYESGRCMRNAIECNRMRNATDSSWASLDCATAREGSQGEQEVEDGAADLLQINCSAPGGPESPPAGGGSRTFPNCFRLNWKVKILRGLVFMSVSIAGLLKQKCLIWWLSGNCVYLSTRELCQSTHFPTICKSEMDSDTSHANKWTEKFTSVSCMYFCRLKLSYLCSKSLSEL